MEYLLQRVEVLMDEFFKNLKYAKKIISCKGWIMERTNEARVIILIKRRMPDGTKKFLLKFEQDIQCMEDVRYVGETLTNMEHYLARIAILNCS